MATTPTRFILKHSSTPNAEPEPESLIAGEIALNIADDKLFYLDENENITGKSLNFESAISAYIDQTIKPSTFKAANIDIDGNLVLTKDNNATVNLGNVIGPQGRGLLISGVAEYGNLLPLPSGGNNRPILPQALDVSGTTFLVTLGDTPSTPNYGGTSRVWIYNKTILNETNRWVNAGLLQGAVGPTGPTGQTGQQGIQGIQGPVGPQGLIGPTGLPGAAGTVVQGINGPVDAAATAATPNTLVQRNARGGGVLFAETDANSTTVTISNLGSNSKALQINGGIGQGVNIITGSGVGLTIESSPNSSNSAAAIINNLSTTFDSTGARITSGAVGAFISGGSTGANIVSNSGTGAIISSNGTGGTFHTKFGNDINSTSDRSFVARDKGAFGWFRNDSHTLRIQAADTITASRTYTIPDSTGTIIPVVPAYANLNAANAALELGELWWDTTTLKLRIATA